MGCGGGTFFSTPSACRPLPNGMGRTGRAARPVSRLAQDHYRSKGCLDVPDTPGVDSGRQMQIRCCAAAIRAPAGGGPPHRRRLLCSALPDTQAPEARTFTYTWTDRRNCLSQACVPSHVLASLGCPGWAAHCIVRFPFWSAVTKRSIPSSLGSVSLSLSLSPCLSLAGPKLLRSNCWPMTL
ncbi:hypothetical protein J3F84DRAFT_285115 [Trichoderma pleuroticola]